MSAELNELQARYDRLKLLHESSQAIFAKLDSQHALPAVLEAAIRAVRGTGGAIASINPTNGLLETEVAQNALPEALDRFLRLGEGIEGRVAQRGESERVADVTLDPRHVPLRSNVRSLLAVPLAVEGQVRGVLSVDADRPDAFTAADQELLEALAVQAAEAIRRAWSYEQFRLKARLFESLVKVSRTINSTFSLEEALEVVVREARGLMQARMASLMMLDETQEWLDLRASSGAGEAYLKKPRLNVADSLLGGVIRRRKPLQEVNVQTSRRYQNVEVARQEGIVSLLSVPLLYSGQAIGALNVYMDKPYAFSNEEIQVLSALAELSGIAIEKARLYERVADVEEQLRQKEKLSALGWLAAEVAHEIRNPLTVMKMLYHSLDLQFPEGDPRVKDARVIREKIDHLNRFVERILDFARTSEPEFAPVNLNQQVEELALLVRHKLTQQHVQLERRLQPALPTVPGDAGQLEQAFLNLILNAAQAMPRGGLLVIETRTVSADGDEAKPTQVEVRFTDTGGGMKPARRKGVFGSLLRSTKKKGTGLGLAIVNRVVEAHRGKITITSQIGQGTCITVRLPVRSD